MNVTVAGLFADNESAGRGVEALIAAGYPPESISVLGRDAASGEGLRREAEDAESDPPGYETLGDAVAGGALGGILGLAVGVVSVVLPGSLIVFGPLAGLIGGTALGATAGAVVGSLRDLGLDEDEAHGYLTSVEAGAVLVAVLVGEESFHRPERVLIEAGARDVHAVFPGDRD